MSDIFDSPASANDARVLAIEPSFDMSKEVSSEVSSDVPADTAGALLKQARQAAGLHIAALAVSLKVPVKKIEALEANRFDLLPDAVFVRALASSVCRALRIDPIPVLERLPQSHISQLNHPHEEINAPLPGTSDTAEAASWARLSHPAALAGLVLLLGALVLIFLPRAGQSPAEEVQPPTVVIAEQGAALAPADLAASAPVVAETHSTQAAAAASTLVAAKPTEIPPEPAAIPVQLLQLKARSASWVSVSDAVGVPVLRRALSAGEVVNVSGVLPMWVIIGQADAIEVTLRDKPFDLTRFTQSGVARFEIR